jgi:hypothetical protein
MIAKRTADYRSLLALSLVFRFMVELSKAIATLLAVIGLFFVIVIHYYPPSPEEWLTLTTHSLFRFVVPIWIGAEFFLTLPRSGTGVAMRIAAITTVCFSLILLT